MQKFRSFIFVLFAAIILVFPTEITLAEESPETKTFTAEKINPGSQFYYAKRGWEKLREKLIFSKAKKIKFYERLLKMRMAEMAYVTENKLLDEVERSSQRIIVFSVRLKDAVSAGTEEDKNRVKDDFFSYREDLVIFRDRFPSDSSYWRLVQYDIDTMDGLISFLK